MISEKYVAGLIDSDGSIHFSSINDNWKPTLVITICQKQSQSTVLYDMKELFGGRIYVKVVKESSYIYYTLIGKAAKALLSRVVKYMVIKRTYSLWCLEMTTLPVKNKDEFRDRVKEARKTQSLPLPNFPTRKWLAGYFDGDGCISVSKVNPTTGNAHLVVTIAAHNDDLAGLSIIHKNFGGYLYPIANGRCTQWRLTEIHQIEKFIEYFCKHSIIKHTQLYLALNYIRSKHITGEQLKMELSKLKTDPQRLNEETP